MKEINRRDFLLGMASVGAAFAGRRFFPAGGILTEPVSRRTLASEPTPTPEPPKLLETIKVDIPDLTVERYSAEFQDITDEVPESYREKLKGWLGLPEMYPFPGGPFVWKDSYSPMKIGWDEYKQTGSLFVGVDRIRLGHLNEFFYFNGDEDRFYANFLAEDSFFPRIHDNDRRILGWEGGSLSREKRDVSFDGKILYELVDSAYGKIAIIIADIPNSTKTIIRDDNLRVSNHRHRPIKAKLSNDGDKLLFYFPFDKDSQRGTYLIDINSWQTQFHLDEPPNKIFTHDIFLNEDGSLLYLLSEKDHIGYLLNTIAGEKKVVRWPTFLTSYTHEISPDFVYIVRSLGMFEAYQWVEGQWGIIAYTPEGFFMINSPKYSLRPHKVDNDGTIYTDYGDIFKFEGGTYKVVEMGPLAEYYAKKYEQPIEVRVRKVG